VARGDGYDLDAILGQPLVRMGIAEGLQKGFLTRGEGERDFGIA